MLSDSLLVRALRGQKTERSPIWLMRQAGRYLPEYRELRKKYKMLELIRNPELASQVTLQPIERFGFDAAIIFADILNPLIGMGIQLDFVEGEGPRIFNPIKNSEDVRRLVLPRVEDNVGYTLDAIKLVSEELTLVGKPIIGFAGAPFTLSSYLLNGKGSPSMDVVKAFMIKEVDAWERLQEKLSSLVTDYLIAQARAGASAVQIFDSWAGGLGPSEFSRFVAPYLRGIIKKVKDTSGVPVIYFATGSAGLFPLFPDLGADAFGVDWRMTLPHASALLGDAYPLQGNLDPALLLGPWEYVREEASRILQESRGLKSHIFNLGHGILPMTPISNVEKLVELVQGTK